MSVCVKQAHPRSRGENSLAGILSRPPTGSSPLTRGKRLREQAQQARCRLIPAHAGKTSRAACTIGQMRAHPRSRGENGWEVGAVPDGEGSSPLTRGKLERLKAGAQRGGLIPAHAGKTQPEPGCEIALGAHPRSRGENSRQAPIRSAKVGSSPLTRGKLAVVLGSAHRRGLIPAHAGKTPQAPELSGSGAAHPRSRGENEWTQRRTWRTRGSSPLTRGKHISYSCYLGVRGLIPAHAGKT